MQESVLPLQLYYWLASFYWILTFIRIAVILNKMESRMARPSHLGIAYLIIGVFLFAYPITRLFILLIFFILGVGISIVILYQNGKVQGNALQKRWFTLNIPMILFLGGAISLAFSEGTVGLVIFSIGLAVNIASNYREIAGLIERWVRKMSSPSDWGESDAVMRGWLAWPVLLLIQAMADVVLSSFIVPRSVVAAISIAVTLIGMYMGYREV